jgi:hypothetical protein
MGEPAWRRADSSYGSGNCVEVAGAIRYGRGHAGVWVADSVRPHCERLYVMRDHWREFTDRVKQDSAVSEPP